MAKLYFPDDFLWGTATAAHQVEGNNKNSDWWQWEQSKDYVAINREWPLEPSAQADDSYNRYEEDFDICKQLNNNAVRFSVEWARIEPQEGKFDQKEIAHYKMMIKAARDRGLKTFVTLHHFTNPIWFAERGGFINVRAAYFFARYAKKCAEEFGSLIDVYLTINEPQVLVLQGYLRGMWPPNKTNPVESLLVQFNLMLCHRAAYNAIKSVSHDYRIGIVKHMVWYDTHTHDHKFRFLDTIACKILFFLNNEFFLMPLAGKLDVLGVNYYFTTRLKHLRGNNPSDRVSDLNWWVNPAGLEKILESLKKYHVPIYITENGIADAKDQLRKAFIRDMLVAVHKAIQNGATVKGYFYWSLIDNYEWHHGYWPRFGLVEIDRKADYERKIRPSAYFYNDICRYNFVDNEEGD